MNTPEQSRITQLLGDSATFDYSSYKDSMDVVFVDGCHDYEYVQSDTLKAMEIIAPGGVIIWHDYLTYDSVTRWLNKWAKVHQLKYIENTSIVYCEINT